MVVVTANPVAFNKYLAVVRVNTNKTRIFSILDAADLSVKLETPDKKAFESRVQELTDIEADKIAKEKAEALEKELAAE